MVEWFSAFRFAVVFIIFNGVFIKLKWPRSISTQSGANVITISKAFSHEWATTCLTAQDCDYPSLLPRTGLLAAWPPSRLASAAFILSSLSSWFELQFTSWPSCLPSSAGRAMRWHNFWPKVFAPGQPSHCNLNKPRGWDFLMAQGRGWWWCCAKGESCNWIPTPTAKCQRQIPEMAMKATTVGFAHRPEVH